MKLVRIEHIRCNEHDGYTYIMAPDDTDEAKLQLDVTTAAHMYQDAIDDFKLKTKKPEYLTLQNGVWPDLMTMGEVKRKIKENDDAHEEYSKARSAATHEFGWYLEMLGYKPLWNAEMLEADVDWGHQHGVTIDCSETTTDYKTPDGKAASKPTVYPLTRKAKV